ncbi:hypothetical protein PAEPH01_0409 [Pancytospora epiphaga]|nr:hypothetical protein PAEPH01_0409 [Pancytospora epiphaga]
MEMKYFQDKALYCYLYICNMFEGETGTCSHCNKRSKTIDNFATQCDRMLYHDYTRRHNEVVHCIHFGLKYIIYMHYHICIHILFKR